MESLGRPDDHDSGVGASSQSSKRLLSRAGLRHPFRGGVHALWPGKPPERGIAARTCDPIDLRLSHVKRLDSSFEHQPGSPDLWRSGSYNVLFASAIGDRTALTPRRWLPNRLTSTGFRLPACSSFSTDGCGTDRARHRCSRFRYPSRRSFA